MLLFLISDLRHAKNSTVDVFREQINCQCVLKTRNEFVTVAGLLKTEAFVIIHTLYTTVPITKSNRDALQVMDRLV